MSGLVISYSGIRGVVGRDLDASVARSFGAAFRRMLTELHSARPITLVVGRDTRASGPELQSALVQGLSDQRVRIIDLDVAPTPTIQFALGALAAHGAVAVTASHNPAQWNCFKFFLAPNNTVLDGAGSSRHPPARGHARRATPRPTPAGYPSRLRSGCRERAPRVPS